MEERRGVVSGFPDSGLQLHTTHSWDFLLAQDHAFQAIPPSVSPPYASNFSAGAYETIIGLLDSGIWPEAPSFSPSPDMDRIPRRWKGECMGGINFSCNGKVIGARYYENPHSRVKITSARDEHGHGTHTASTAAGMPVNGASYYGLAKGRARGGSPASRIAVYRVCGRVECSESALLKAFDDAIDDRVDVISVSIGNGVGDNFFADPIAIGAFHATARGITVVCSAGNGGPTSTSPYQFYQAWPPFDDIHKIPGRNPPLYVIISGTSMSCPRVAAIAALVQSHHPTWSPSAIRSAIITTVATPYDIGSGEISLTAPLRPGLVYETETTDYIQFICNLGYNTSMIKIVASNLTAHNFSCPCTSHRDFVSDMNYPSISISGLKTNRQKTVRRTVTNVGDPYATYTVTIEAPPSLKVQVVPTTLQFTQYVQKLTFHVTFKDTASSASEEHSFGAITWTDGKHKVRSPFAVRRRGKDGCN
ncbi:CO(2)-response secreted protease [Striga hermonthica]|uniref:CO(2)-response secreted protease n=1 Tax=Striga hermonthica TaxID=68872 RepID=A0A9N7NI24_STRHE|nr:CO(2)-response secreted protease [Striga hermonthica]